MFFFVRGMGFIEAVQERAGSAPLKGSEPMPLSGFDSPGNPEISRDPIGKQNQPGVNLISAIDTDTWNLRYKWYKRT